MNNNQTPDYFDELMDGSGDWLKRNFHAYTHSKSENAFDLFKQGTPYSRSLIKLDKNMHPGLMATQIQSSVRRVVNTVASLDPSGQEIQVGFSGKDSYTRAGSRKITVNVEAFGKDKEEVVGNDANKALDITLGFAVHEALHVLRTKEGFKDPVQGYVGTKGQQRQAKALRKLFWNTVEDERIEQWGGDNVPGYMPYVAAAKRYAMEKNKAENEGFALQLMKAADPALGEIMEFANVVYDFIRYPGNLTRDLVNKYEKELRQLQAQMTPFPTTEAEVNAITDAVYEMIEDKITQLMEPPPPQQSGEKGDDGEDGDGKGDESSDGNGQSGDQQNDDNQSKSNKNQKPQQKNDQKQGGGGSGKNDQDDKNDQEQDKQSGGGGGGGSQDDQKDKDDKQDEQEHQSGGGAGDQDKDDQQDDEKDDQQKGGGGGDDQKDEEQEDDTQGDEDQQSGDDDQQEDQEGDEQEQDGDSQDGDGDDENDENDDPDGEEEESDGENEEGDDQDGENEEEGDGDDDGDGENEEQDSGEDDSEPQKTPEEEFAEKQEKLREQLAEYMEKLANQDLSENNETQDTSSAANALNTSTSQINSSEYQENRDDAADTQPDDLKTTAHEYPQTDHLKSHHIPIEWIDKGKVGVGNRYVELRYQASLQDVAGHAAAMRRRLERLNRNHRQTLYAQFEGDLDDSRLAEVRTKTPFKNFYTQEYDVKNPGATIVLLIDESGSMNMEQEIARRIAILFERATDKLNGIDLYVYGHTTGERRPHTDSTKIFKYYEGRKKGDRTALGQISAHDTNRDGHAILEVGLRVRKLIQKPKERIIMIVISDGMPSASTPYGFNGVTYTKACVNYLEKYQNMDVIQVGIKSGIPSKDMFNKFVTFTNFGTLVNDMGALLEGIIKKVNTVK